MQHWAHFNSISRQVHIMLNVVCRVLSDFFFLFFLFNVACCYLLLAAHTSKIFIKWKYTVMTKWCVCDWCMIFFFPMRSCRCKEPQFVNFNMLSSHTTQNNEAQISARDAVQRKRTKYDFSVWVSCICNVFAEKTVIERWTQYMRSRWVSGVWHAP